MDWPIVTVVPRVCPYENKLRHFADVRGAPNQECTYAVRDAHQLRAWITGAHVRQCAPAVEFSPILGCRFESTKPRGTRFGNPPIVKSQGRDSRFGKKRCEMAVIGGGDSTSANYYRGYRRWS